MAIQPYLAPVKTLAKQYAKQALKAKLKTPLVALLKKVISISTKIFTKVKSVVGKIPIWGKGWAAKINVAQLSAKMAGIAASASVNFILNILVPNISIFLSVGGVVAGILDIWSDRILDNKITIPFK